MNTTPTCEMLHVNPDFNGHGVESPCLNIATHVLCRSNIHVCDECLVGLCEDKIDEGLKATEIVFL